MLLVSWTAYLDYDVDTFEVLIVDGAVIQDVDCDGAVGVTNDLDDNLMNAGDVVDTNVYDEVVDGEVDVDVDADCQVAELQLLILMMWSMMLLSERMLLLMLLTLLLLLLLLLLQLLLLLLRLLPIMPVMSCK